MWTSILAFLKSTVLTNSIQLVAASAAFIIYLLKKREEKQNAARIIVIELRNAERKVQEVSQVGVHRETKPILPINSWKDYKHMFAKNLDTDEFEFVNDFYARCQRLETARKQCVSIFTESLEEKARLMQNVLVYNIKDNINDLENIKKSRDKLIENINKEDFVFSPNEPQRIVKETLTNIQNVTTSSAGIKLKKIAEIK